MNSPTYPIRRPPPARPWSRIEAAALNFFDTLIIAGKYQTKPAFPFSPSAEFAGVVEASAPDVTGFKVGDRVVGMTGYGAAREKIAVPASKLVKNPEGLDSDRAAGLSVTYGTTLHALKDRAKLKAGETLGGARRIGRNRPCGNRARQNHGRTRDRLRVIGRQDCLLPEAWRR